MLPVQAVHPWEVGELETSIAGVVGLAKHITVCDLEQAVGSLMFKDKGRLGTISVSHTTFNTRSIWLRRLRAGGYRRTDLLIWRYRRLQVWIGHWLDPVEQSPARTQELGFCMLCPAHGADFNQSTHGFPQWKWSSILKAANDGIIANTSFFVGIRFIIIPANIITATFRTRITIFAFLAEDMPLSALPLKVCHKKQEKFHPTLEAIDGKEP
jgi:hypothetical protein